MTDEVNNLSKYRKAQKTFGKLFLISFGVLFVFLLFTPLFFYRSLDSKAPALSNSSVQNTNSTVYGTPDENFPKGTPALSNTYAENTEPTFSNRPIVKTTPRIKATPRISPGSSPQMTPDAPREESFPFVLAAFIATGAFSLFATVFTFLGFLTMTIFAWRKEKREAATFRLDSEKKAMEIEKLRVELEKSKTASAPPIKKCARCNRTYEDVSLNFCLEDGALLSEIHKPAETGQNPFDKTQIMESNLPTEEIKFETDEIKNKNTAE